MTHKEILQQAEMDCRRIDECLPYYLENGDSLLEQARAQVVRAEYAVGGTIHRGCYCPSPVRDIIVGRTKRGVLRKKPGVKEKTHVYGFNSEDQLVYVEHPWSAQECIFRSDDREFSVVYDTSWGSRTKIAMVCECIYEQGKLQRYTEYKVSPYHWVMDFTREEYAYSLSGLSSAVFQSYTSDKAVAKLPPKVPDAGFMGVAEHVLGSGGADKLAAALASELFKSGFMHLFSRFIFEHDDEGYLSQYVLIPYSGRNLENPRDPEGPYQIKKRRRV